MNKDIVRVKNNAGAIIWHETSKEIPELHESQEALVLMYCKDWEIPVTGTCRIGWDGSYYLDWLPHNKEQEVKEYMNDSDYFSPDFWAYVNFPKL